MAKDLSHVRIGEKVSHLVFTCVEIAVVGAIEEDALAGFGVFCGSDHVNRLVDLLVLRKGNGFLVEYFRVLELRRKRVFFLLCWLSYQDCRGQQEGEKKNEVPHIRARSFHECCLSLDENIQESATVWKQIITTLSNPRFPEPCSLPNQTLLSATFRPFGAQTPIQSPCRSSHEYCSRRSHVFRVPLCLEEGLLVSSQRTERLHI